MKVLLLEDVENVGTAGAVVEVPNGFARNVLFPHGRAAAATAGRLKEAEAAKARAAQESEEELGRLQALIERLDQKTITLTLPAGPEGKLNGAVTAKDIAGELSKTLGADIPSKAVRLQAPLRDIGEQKVSLEFSHGLEAEVTVVVTASTPTTADTP
jgi:large subunit ribosomal protein L9